MNRKIKLQPLRIPTGWQISWNRFYEIDPPEIISDEYRQYFDQNIFFAMYYSMERGRRIGLDLSWNYLNESGTYILSLVHYTEIKIKENHKTVIKIRKERQTLNYRLEPNFTSDQSNWDHALLISRSRIEIVEKMDEVMYDVEMNRNSRYWQQEDK
jgi:hypothetical protein